MQSPIAFLVLKNQLAAWILTPSSVPRRLKIHGETTLSLSSCDGFIDAFVDITENLRGDGIRPSEMHWLIDRESRSLWRESHVRLGEIGTSTVTSLPVWQRLDWEWTARRLGLSSAQDLEDATFIENQVLPWLVTADQTAERQKMQEMLALEYQSESDRLATERLHLQQENERLRMQNLALQQVDAKRLVSFLPALFPRVFTVLGSTDLALLCGQIEPLPISNPYPEPSEEALRALQRRFRSLPRDVQAQIVRFVAHLPQRQKLVPRPEMRDVVNELEEG